MSTGGSRTSAPAAPLGITVPLDGLPLAEQAQYLQRLAAAGYSDVWTAEGPGTPDAFVPLAVASAIPSLRLGAGVVPVYTRGPATLAQCAATLGDTAPGRVTVGIGSSSKFVVEGWNDGDFSRPYARVRDTLRFLRRALDGEQVDEVFDTFTIRKFQLRDTPVSPPRLMVGALRERMLRLAGREADGAILAMLATEDVPGISRIVRGEGDQAELVARVVVVPSEDSAAARLVARSLLATYVNIPVYAEFHRWLGRGHALQRCWDIWESGRRREAADAIPDEVVDMLVPHGTPAECRAQLERFRAAGIDTPVVGIVPVEGVDPLAAARAIAESPSCDSHG